jgi:HAD superfamily hydrolase (TIGR01490 family)
MSKSTQRPVVAVFDFDGTLTRRDSLLPFLRRIAGAWGFWFGIVRLAPWLIAYALRVIPNHRAKRAVLAHFLAGRALADVSESARRFSVQELNALLRPEAMARLRWHQAQGHRTVLLSASPALYLLPWAGAHGFDAVLGTELAVVEGRLTGDLVGGNCYGPEKVVRLRQLLGDLGALHLYAYGDSRGDRELLAQADHPYYRSFGQADHSDPRPGWERGLLLTAVLTAGLYLALAFWGGLDPLVTALATLPASVIPALLGIVFVSYCLRFWRWQWYLSALGHRPPLVGSFRIFLASFALTASPGKAGESIKSLLLKRRYGLPVAPTLAGLFCERFTDALSVVLLLALGAATPAHQWPIWAVGTVQVALILLLQRGALIERLVLVPLGTHSRFGPSARRLRELLASARTLLRPRLLLGGTLLAACAWGLEGLALYALFQHLGAAGIAPHQAIFAHTSAGLLGALSFLPGGIGGTEALLVSLALLYGASRPVAVTATFCIRLLTLWFAVALGLLCLIAERRRPAPIDPIPASR